jgi:stage V sporulation protein B
MRVKGAIYLTASTLTFMVSGYLTNVWLGRYLGPKTYGVYGVLISLMTALNVMQIYGVPQAVSKFVAEKPKKAHSILNSGLKIQLVLTVFIGIAFFLSAPVFALVFKDSSLENYIRAFSLIFPFYGAFTVYAGYYNGLHEFKKQATINAAYSISKLLLVVSLTLWLGLYGAIIGFILSPIIALFFGFCSPDTNNDYPHKQIIFYSIPLIIFAALATMQLSIDLFTLKALKADAKIAGFYTAAQNIALIPYMGMAAIGQVLFPSVSHFLGTGKVEETRHVIGQSLRYLLLLLLPITTLLVATAHDLISLLFGVKYLPATTALRILLVSYAFLTIFAMLANVLNGAGKAKLSMIIAGSGVIVGFISCLLLIPRLSSKGAAIGTMIGAFLSAILSIASTYKIFKFHFSFLSLFRIIIGTIVVLLGGTLIPISPLMLPIIYLLLVVFYLIVLYTLGEFSNEDRMQIKNLLPAWLPFARLI